MLTADCILSEETRLLVIALGRKKQIPQTSMESSLEICGTKKTRQKI
jgi:hypothetical protein